MSHDSAAAPAAPPPFPRFAFRIITGAEHAAFATSGSYPGSPLDARDNFMHLAPLSEVVPTANAYFAGHTDLHVLQVELSKVPGAVLRHDWVASRAAWFPHILGGDNGFAIPQSAVVEVHKLAQGADGGFMPLALQ
jgi:uncharacterized protein (DUF952 family)